MVKRTVVDARVTDVEKRRYPSKHYVSMMLCFCFIINKFSFSELLRCMRVPLVSLSYPPFLSQIVAFFRPIEASRMYIIYVLVQIFAKQDLFTSKCQYRVHTL